MNTTDSLITVNDEKKCTPGRSSTSKELKILEQEHRFRIEDDETCEAQQAYLGLLTMLIGILIPSPKFNDKNSSD